MMAMLVFSSCSVVNKLKSGSKTKTETFSREVQLIDLTETERTIVTGHNELTETITAVLSSIDWQYNGIDSAEIEISQTAGGIKIKTKGTATAGMQSQTVSGKSVSDYIYSNQTYNHTEQTKLTDNQTEARSKAKNEDSSKKVIRTDFSVWFWLVLLIALLLSIFLYFKFRKTQK